MKVRELIRELKAMDPEMEVYFAHPSHDYWRSELASEVERVDEERVHWSEYHGQMNTIDEDKVEKYAAKGEELLEVVILR